jgi:hypothetical protein
VFAITDLRLSDDGSDHSFTVARNAVAPSEANVWKKDIPCRLQRSRVGQAGVIDD